MKSRLTRLGLTRSRLTRSRLGAAIGVAVLLSVASPKPARPDSAETPDSGAPTTESSVPTAEPGAPTKVVDALHENLISVMKDSKELGYKGRFERLEPALTRKIRRAKLEEKIEDTQLIRAMYFSTK